MAVVLVVGGGMSGLVAGIAAAQAGAEVLVLEKGPHAGGSMRLSGGLIWAPRDLETARRFIPKGSARKQEFLISQVEGLWRWLEDDLGLPLEPVDRCLKDNMGLGRTMGLGSGGDRGPFADQLVGLLKAFGGILHCDAAVTGMRPANGRWRVRSLSHGVEQIYDADRVIFASGGFQNSPDLIRRWITPYADDLIVRSNRHSDGVAVRTLESLGAQFSGGMSSFYGHSLPDVPQQRIKPHLFIPASQYYTDYCVLLNRLGLRFTDESLGVLDEHNAQQGSRQAGARYVAVFDERIRQERVLGRAGLPGILASALPDRVGLAAELGAFVTEVLTLDGLAESLASRGLPPENVRHSIETFNGLGSSAQVFPSRGLASLPIAEPPFYAVECVAAVTYTMGGIAVDDACRVLTSKGPLDGVFAVGADAGGVFEDVYGGGLAWAGTTGLLAGREAAR